MFNIHSNICMYVCIYTFTNVCKCKIDIFKFNDFNYVYFAIIHWLTLSCLRVFKVNGGLHL